MEKGDKEFRDPAPMEWQKDTRERRELRHKYRELAQRIKDDQHELAEASSDGLQEKLVECNNLFKNVRMTREAAIDSSIIAQISQLGKQKAQALQADLVVFQPTEFCDKLMSFLHGGTAPIQPDAATGISREGWVRLGDAVQPFFKRSPPIHFMYGSFEAGEKKKKEIQRRVKPRDDTGPENVLNVKSLQSDENLPKTESTTEQVEAILTCLKKQWLQADRTPICYFEFVVNPTSFGQTVENIFYTSFLIRDGVASIYLDEDELPVIEPVEKKNSRAKEANINKQVMMTITKQDWRDLIEAYNIQQPTIPTRARVHHPEVDDESDEDDESDYTMMDDSEGVTQTGSKSKTKSSAVASNVESEDDDVPSKSKKSKK